MAYESGDAVIGDAVDVLAATGFPGDAETIVNALLNAGGPGRSGFIEETSQGSGIYLVHDLYDHAPRYVQRRWQRELERRRHGQEAKATIEASRNSEPRKAQSGTKSAATESSHIPPDIPTDPETVGDDVIQPETESVRSVSGQCPVSDRPVSGQCPVSDRSVSGQCPSLTAHSTQHTAHALKRDTERETKTDRPAEPVGADGGGKPPLDPRPEKWTSATYEFYRSVWNEMAAECGLAITRPVDRWTQARKRRLRASVKQFGQDDVVKVLTSPTRSAFLRGVTGRESWTGLTFDKALEPRWISRILEGTYDDKHRNTQRTGTGALYDQLNG